MQITLKQRDIELALKMYLAAQGIALANRTFDVEFTAGRKEAGLMAAIDIGTADSLTEAVVAAVKEAVPLEVPETKAIDLNQMVVQAAAVVVEQTTPVQDPDEELENEPPFGAHDELDTPIVTLESAVKQEAPLFTPEAAVPVAAPVVAPKPVSLFA